jgi:hypothetical protein
MYLAERPELNYRDEQTAALRLLRASHSPSSRPARTQFTDPRAYDNTPVGINQLELGYAYVSANASIDMTTPGAGAVDEPGWGRASLASFL